MEVLERLRRFEFDFFENIISLQRPRPVHASARYSGPLQMSSVTGIARLLGQIMSSGHTENCSLVDRNEIQENKTKMAPHKVISLATNGLL